jgi:RimJ/RimL family protein N-acetyltransferase
MRRDTEIEAMTVEPSIRAARIADLGAYLDYVMQHVAESGRGGSPHFATSRSLDRDEVREGAISRWSRTLSEPLWGRAWLLWLPDRGEAIGHLELRGGRVRAEMHRAVLAMGIRREFTARGHGRRLLDAAIAWARDEAGLSWIDLGVFSENAPARKLYARAGFVELGLRRDAYRLEGRLVIDDVHMALDLGRPAQADHPTR